MPRSLLPLLTQFALPHVCLICGRYTRAKLDCCPECEVTLPILEARCLRCGLGVERLTPMCNACLLAMPSFDKSWPGFERVAMVERWLQQFRREANFTVGRFLSDIYARRLAAMGATRPDLMIPMPMHVIDYCLQGFDHNRWFCKALSKRMSRLPIYPALKLTRYIKKQHRLPSELRWANVRGAYAIRAIPSSTRYAVLVDDVMSSGHSVNEAARVLKKAGIERVDVWAVIRAVGSQ